VRYVHAMRSAMRESSDGVVRCAHMRLLIVVGALCLARPSFAADSTWLLCKGKTDGGIPLVVSAFEQRAASGDQRDLSLTVVRGDHVSRGVARNVDEGKAAAFTARTVDKWVTIEGKVTLVSGMTALTLSGTIDPSFGHDTSPKRVAFKAKLTCETVD
jgi:hypothetical protein